MSIYINKDTKVITQGITGKTGQFHTEKCQEYANGKNCFCLLYTSPSPRD